MANADEIVMYLVARTDLAMSPGKLGVQIGHGVHLALRAAERAAESSRVAREELYQWEGSNYTKILLKVKGEQNMLNLHENLTKSGVPSCLVRDLGRTEIAAGSLTILSLVPMWKSKVQALAYMKRLQLY